MKDRIDFKTNWNNKLNCNVFSTIRPQRTNKKYNFGKLYEIYLNEEYKGLAQIILIESYHISEFRDIECLLDTGYNKEETLKIISKMYNNYYSYFDFIILKYISLVDEKNPPLLTGGY